MSIVPYIKALWPVPSCVNFTTYVQGSSDYEVICQILQKLNETVHSFNTLDDAVTELSSKYDSLKDYVDSELSELKVYIDDKFTSINIRQFVDEVLSAHPEWTTTVQDGSITKEKFTAELANQTLNNFVTPQMYGAAGDGVTDDSDAFQQALIACYGGKNQLYVPNGTYRIEKTLKIYEFTRIYGNGAVTLPKITCPTSVSTLFDIVLHEGSSGTYPQKIHIESLSILFDTLDESTVAIHADTCPYLHIKNVSIRNVGYGIKIDTDTWISSLTDVSVTNCFTGVYHRIRGTSFNLKRVYVYDAQNNGFDFSGMTYASFESCAVDRCQGIPYLLKFYTGTLISCGSESPDADKVLDCRNSNISLSSCFFYTPRNYILDVNGSTLNSLNSVLGNSVNETARLFNPRNTDYKINIQGGRIACHIPETPRTVDTQTIINTRNVQKEYSSGVGMGMDNIRHPCVTSPAFGTPSTAEYGDRGWGQPGVAGDIIPNASPANGVAMFVQLTTNNKITTNLTVVGISGNTLTLSSDTFPAAVTNYSANLTDFVFVKSTDYKTTTPITNASGTLVTVEDASNITIGDAVILKLASATPTYMRDCVFGQVPYIQRGTTAQRPQTAVNGVSYFDTTINKPIWKTASGWVDATGATV